jgi:hypothetical protein
MRSTVAGISLFACTLLTACSSNTLRSDCLDVDEVRTGQRTGTASVCGYLSYRFEDKNLYSSAIAAENYDNRQCIAVGLAPGFDSTKLRALSGRPVRLTGRLTDHACPEGAICSASCSQIGIFVEDVQPASL